MKPFKNTVLCILLTCSTCVLAQSDAEILKAMRGVEKNWRIAIERQQPFLMRCAENTWSMVRIVRGGMVSMDLLRTNSLVSPFRGVIRIEAGLESNGRSPRANGFYNEYAKPPSQACFSTSEQAKEATQPDDWEKYNDRKLNEMISYYDVVDGVVQLVGGNDMFRNAVGDRIALPQNYADWKNVLVQSVR